jgi:uncharacterized protein (TIGR02246 family)
MSASHPPTSAVPVIVALSDAQLVAYNRQDTEAFVDCFTEDVVVLDAAGERVIEGKALFRERYRSLFEGYAEVGARVLGRLVLPPHIVELETWYRRRTADGPLEEGQVIVRYTERDGLIATVAFLRPGA